MTGNVLLPPAGQTFLAPYPGEAGKSLIPNGAWCLLPHRRRSPLVRKRPQARCHSSWPALARPALTRTALTRPAAAAPGRPAAGRTPRRGRRARPAAVPGQPAVPALLRPVYRPPGRDERPAAGGPRPADPGPSAPAADPRARARLRRRDHPQDAVAHVRRGAGRVGADALPGPGHDVRVLAGGLRDGLPVLRHRAGGPDPQ